MLAGDPMRDLECQLQNRFYVKRQQKPTIQEVCLTSFKQTVFSPLVGKLMRLALACHASSERAFGDPGFYTEAFLALVDKDRLGEQVDR